MTSYEQAIVDLCEMAGMPEMASELIRKGVTVEEAPTRLLAMKRGGQAIVKDAQRRAQAEQTAE
ncbi:MAG: hypothetical protein SWE60_05855 [Thermodesulfobacteriota bacterium]|nr:hypothetical protein [Thermodesulfobacteriota bacterium]